MTLVRSLYPPLAAALLIAVTLGVGYRYADVSHHRPPPPTRPPGRAFPGTAIVRGNLIAYGQRVMTIRTSTGTYGVILALGTIELPRCGRLPSLRPGEALEARVPVEGDGTLLAVTVQDDGQCRR